MTKEEKKKLSNKKYYEKNKDIILKKNKEYIEKSGYDRSKADEKYYEKNKEIILLKNKDWYDENKNKSEVKESRKEYADEWRKNNKEYQKEYYKENKDKFLEYKKNYVPKDMLIFKLKSSISSSIRGGLIRNGFTKKNNTENILGCKIEEFKIYLENKFEDWMNWENRGLYNGEFNYGWDIDHIIPVSSASTEEELIRLNHYTNLQPLCSKINRDIKKDKVGDEINI